MATTFKEKLIWSGDARIEENPTIIRIRMKDLDKEPILIKKGVSCSEAEYKKLEDELKKNNSGVLVCFFIVSSHYLFERNTEKFIALNLSRVKYKFVQGKKGISDRPCGSILHKKKDRNGKFYYFLINFVGEYTVIEAEEEFNNWQVITAEGELNYLTSPFNKDVTMPTYKFTDKGVVEESKWVPA